MQIKKLMKHINDVIRSVGQNQEIEAAKMKHNANKCFNT